MYAARIQPGILISLDAYKEQQPADAYTATDPKGFRHGAPNNS